MSIFFIFLCIGSESANTASNIKIPSIKCSNCEQIFSKEIFEEHICEYDENSQYIEDELPTDGTNEDHFIASKNDIGKCSPNEESLEDSREHFPNHSILMKLLDNNNGAISKWLKTDYKLDLTKLYQQGDTLNASIEQPTTKKHEGPHCCTMCDRKFVHASGLSRHMEKHEHDKSVGTAWSAAMTHDPGAASSLETAIKCTKCSRVFRRAEDCLEHILFAHEIEQLFGDTIDFSDDEMDEMDKMEKDQSSTHDLEISHEVILFLLLNK